MKKVIGWFAVIALALNMNAMATPIYTPFVGVDLNGGQGSYGPTQAAQSGEPAGTPAWQGWNVNDGDFFVSPTTVTKSFPTAGVASGSITVSLTGVGTSLSARNRTALGSTEPWADVQRDFVFANRNTAIGLGRHYLEFDVSGLNPNTSYEFTMFGFDPSSAQTGNDRGYMAWGVQNPATYLDNNVGSGQSYQPAVGGTNNPIPTLARAPITGPSPSQSGAGGTFTGGFYFYSGSFIVTSNASGNASVFGWNDANSFSSQTISMANGFQIGATPEPTSIMLLGIGLVAFAAGNRRRVQ
jgi:hypothetical protein